MDFAGGAGFASDLAQVAFPRFRQVRNAHRRANLRRQARTRIASQISVSDNLLLILGERSYVT